MYDKPTIFTPELMDEFQKFFVSASAFPEFSKFRLLDDGALIYTERLAFTYAVCLGPQVKDGESMMACTPWLYRFCFPQWADALRFFDEAKTYTDVPTFGWVANRPEGRLMNTKELIYFHDLKTTSPEIKELMRSPNRPIDEMMELGAYTKTVFDRWLEAQKTTIGEKDVGVQAFYRLLCEQKKEH